MQKDLTFPFYQFPLRTLRPRLSTAAPIRVVPPHAKLMISFYLKTGPDAAIILLAHDLTFWDIMRRRVSESFDEVLFTGVLVKINFNSNTQRHGRGTKKSDPLTASKVAKRPINRWVKG